MNLNTEYGHIFRHKARNLQNTNTFGLLVYDQFYQFSVQGLKSFMNGPGGFWKGIKMIREIPLVLVAIIFNLVNV